MWGVNKQMCGKLSLTSMLSGWHEAASLLKTIYVSFLEKNIIILLTLLTTQIKEKIPYDSKIY